MTEQKIPDYETIKAAVAGENRHWRRSLTVSSVRSTSSQR